MDSTNNVLTRSGFTSRGSSATTEVLQREEIRDSISILEEQQGYYREINPLDRRSIRRAHGSNLLEHTTSSGYCPERGDDRSLTLSSKKLSSYRKQEDPLHGDCIAIMDEFSSLMNDRVSRDDFIKKTKISVSEQEKYFDFFGKLSCELFLAKDYISSKNINPCMIVVCGKQSSGKSSLIAGWTGIKTEISQGTSTKQAIVYQFINGKSFQAKVMSIENGENNFRSMRELNSFMRDTQRKIKGDISSDTLYVEITSPFCQRMTLVDLPGDILDKDEESKKIREKMYSKYVNSNNIVLRVIPADMDHQTDEKFQKMLQDGLDSSILIINTKSCSAATVESDRYASQNHRANGLFNNGFYYHDNNKIPVFGVDIPEKNLNIICEKVSSECPIQDSWNELDHDNYSKIKHEFDSKIESDDVKNKIVGHEGVFGLHTSFNAVSWLLFKRNRAMYELIKNEIPICIKEITGKIESLGIDIIFDNVKMSRFVLHFDLHAFSSSLLQNKFYKEQIELLRKTCTTFSGPSTLEAKTISISKKLEAYLSGKASSKESKDNQEKEIDLSKKTGSIKRRKSFLKIHSSKEPSCEPTKELCKKEINYITDINEDFSDHEGICKIQLSFISFMDIAINSIINSATELVSSPSSSTRIQSNIGLALNSLTKDVWEFLHNDYSKNVLKLSDLISSHIYYNFFREAEKKGLSLSPKQIEYFKNKIYQNTISIVSKKYQDLYYSIPSLKVVSTSPRVVDTYRLFFRSIGIGIDGDKAISLDDIKFKIQENKHKVILGAKIAAATAVIGGVAVGTISAISPLLPFLGVSFAALAIISPSTARSVVSSGAKAAKMGIKGGKKAIVSTVNQGKEASEKDNLQKEINKDVGASIGFDRDIEINLDYPDFFARAEAQTQNVQNIFFSNLREIYKESLIESVGVLMDEITSIKTNEFLKPELYEGSNSQKYKNLIETRNEFRKLNSL